MKKEKLLFLFFITFFAFCSCAHTTANSNQASFSRVCSNIDPFMDSYAYIAYQCEGQRQKNKKAETQERKIIKKVVVNAQKPEKAKIIYRTKQTTQSTQIEPVKPFKFGSISLFGIIPRRVTPFVLRIWIAPWRDEQDRLKWSRTIYVDLPINKWNLGVKPAETDEETLKILSTQSTGTVLRFKNNRFLKKKLNHFAR